MCRRRHLLTIFMKLIIRPLLISPTPLHLELKGPRLDLLESSEIKLAIRNNRNILNNQLVIKKQPIIDMFISKH